VAHNRKAKLNGNVPQLPADIWILIFKLLESTDLIKTCIGVSKLWNTIGWNIIPNVHFPKQLEYNMDAICGTVFPKCLHLKSLELPYSSTNSVLEIIPFQLERLDLTGCTQIDGNGLNCLTRLKSLEYLNLSFVKHEWIAEGPKYSGEQIAALTTLKSLHMLQRAAVNILGAQRVSILPSLPSSLETLAISVMDSKGAHELTHLTQLTTLIVDLPPPRRIELSYCSLKELRVIRCSAEFLKKMVRKFPKSITKFGIIGCKTSLDVSLLAHLTNVETLDISNNPYLIPTTLCWLPYSLTELDIAHCGGVRDKDVWSIPTTVTTLTISGDMPLRDTIFQRLPNVNLFIED